MQKCKRCHWIGVTYSYRTDLIEDATGKHYKIVMLCPKCGGDCMKVK